MTEELPTLTPEQRAFTERTHPRIVTLIFEEMDFREAERVAAHEIAEAMRSEGAGEAEVDALLQWALDIADTGLSPEDNAAPVSADLLDRLVESYKLAGGARRVSRFLAEKRVQAKTGYPMFLFPNESKHPGFPHVTVELGDDKVNISISDNPTVIAGNKNARGIREILAAVKEHQAALKQEWDASRPDDQKLENSRRRKAAAATGTKKRR